MKLHALGISCGSPPCLSNRVPPNEKSSYPNRCSRRQLLAFTANLQVQLIGMESCRGAHFLGRALREQAHSPLDAGAVREAACADE
jgi:transposase